MKHEDRFWAIVLAGGQGHRLQSLLRRHGHRSPIKQFCAVIGKRSPLQHTWDRVDRLVPADRVLTVLDRAHVPMFPEQLGSRAPGTLIAQPTDRETAPGTLLALAYVLRADPRAVVGLFPSDHFIHPARRFMAHVWMAAMSVQRELQDIVVLGVESRRPDSDYGWIEVVRTGRLPGSCLLPVARFWEKPSPAIARSLHDGGHLWSTMVTVARAAALWQIILDAQPELRRPFERIQQALGTAREADVIRQEYEELPCISLSKCALERATARVGAVTVREVYWNDCGSEERMRETWRWRDATARGAHPAEDRFCVDWAVADPQDSVVSAPRAQPGNDVPIDLADAR